MGVRRRGLRRVLRRCRAAGLALLAAAVLAVALASAAVATNEFPDPPSTPAPGGDVLKPPTKIKPYIPRVTQPQCPKLVGQTLNSAKQIAAANKIALAPITYRPSDAVPGVIIEQQAAARRGDGIYLCAVVVAQAWTVTVPKLIGTTVNNAPAVLGDPGYHKLLALARQRQQRESDQPPGTIIAQTPAPGTQVNAPTLIYVVLAAPRPTVVVPKVVGLMRPDAEATIAQPGYRGWLTLSVSGGRELTLPAGTIVEQSPAAGTTISGAATLLVVLARPPVVVVVPDLTGQVPGAAAQALANGYRGLLRLRLAGTRAAPGRPAGTIVAQDPVPGTRVTKPTEIRAWTAEPPPVVVVPDLSGLAPGAGIQTLGADTYRGLLRLKVVGERPAADRPAGTIVAQDRSAGTRVTNPTVITAWVAASPPVRVPDLSTLPPPAAGQRLSATEFRGLLSLGAVHQRSSTARAGTIVAQQPPPQTPVTTPTKIEIWIAETPPAVVVPDLVNFKPPDAKVHLAAETFGGLLTLGDIREREADKPEGVIVEQKPLAGAKVSAPTKIDVWVAVNRLVVVPDLSTLTRDGALAALTKVGLTLGGARSERSDRPSGSVIGQTPEAGRRVPVGTAVSIVLVAPPVFWKPTYVIAAVLVVLLVAAAQAAWRRWRPRLHRVAYQAREGGAPEVTLEAPEPAGSAVRLRADRGSHETYTIDDGGIRPRRRSWPKMT